MPHPVSQITFTATGLADTLNDEIGTALGNNSKIKLFDSSDTELHSATLDAVMPSSSGGVLSLTVQTSGSASAGTVAYARLTTSADGTVLEMPVEAGTVAVLNKVVLNTLTLTSGIEVNYTSIDFGV